jgi:hypothetical protein
MDAIGRAVRNGTRALGNSIGRAYPAIRDHITSNLPTYASILVTYGFARAVGNQFDQTTGDFFRSHNLKYLQEALGYPVFYGTLIPAIYCFKGHIENLAKNRRQ